MADYELLENEVPYNLTGLLVDETDLLHETGADVEAAAARTHGADFELIVGVWVPGGFCICGIIGNMLSLIVLSLDRSKCPTFYTLRALATSDLCLLLTAFFQQVIPMYFRYIGCGEHQGFCMITGYLYLYMWPPVCMAQMISIWLTVLISAERYIAICHPLQSIHMRSISKGRIAILTIVSISVIYNLPRFFEFRPLQVLEPRWNLTMVEVEPTGMRNNIAYRYVYNTALFALFVYAIPLVILVFLNVRIISEMRNCQKSWELLNRRQQRELKATVMPLIIVIIFIICCTQSFLVFVLDAVYPDSYGTKSWLQIYMAVVNLLVIFNAAVNFFIFYLFGRKFRLLLKRFLFCDMASDESNITRWRWRNRPIHG